MRRFSMLCQAKAASLLYLFHKSRCGLCLSQFAQTLFTVNKGVVRQQSQSLTDIDRPKPAAMSKAIVS